MAEIIQIKDGSTNALPIGEESGSGYCKMPNGTLIQWGTETFPADGYTISVYFQIQFANTNYSVLVSPHDNGIDLAGGSPKYTTHFTAGRAPAGANNIIEWLAIGRWK